MIKTRYSRKMKHFSGQKLGLLFIAVVMTFSWGMALPAMAVEESVLGADRVALMDLIARYSYTWDARDIDAFAKLYTDDAVWVGYVNNGTEPYIHLKTREGIRQGVKKRGEMFAKWGVVTKHFMVDSVITMVGEGKAKARTMALITWQRPEFGDFVPRPVQAGYYDSVFEKENGIWKFSRRDVYLTGVFDPKDVYGDAGAAKR